MPTDTPTPTPAPTETATPSSPAGDGGVSIVCIFFDGVVSRQEPDEYVEIVNASETDRDLNGWRLVDVSDDGPTFTFSAIVIPAGGRVRVYTNEVHEDWGGLSFGRGTAIWSNSEPDTAGLFDGAGMLVSSKTYPPGCP